MERVRCEDRDWNEAQGELAAARLDHARALLKRRVGPLDDRLDAADRARQAIRRGVRAARRLRGVRERLAGDIIAQIG